MSSRTEEYDEICQIADAICDGDASETQKKRLQVLIQNDDKAQQFYLEYMDMHASLLADDQDLEMTIRRFQYEEISIGKKGSTPPPINPLPPTGDTLCIEDPRKRNVWPYILGIILIIALCVMYYLSQSSKALLIFQKVENVKDSKGMLIQEGDSGFVEVYQIEGNCQVKTVHGDIITIQGPGTLSLKTPRHFILDGKIIDVVNGLESQDLIIGSSGLELASQKSVYSLLKKGETFELSVSKGKVKSYSKLGLPKHYLPMNDVTDRTSDVFGSAHASSAGTCEKTDGLIGSGAVRFNNL